MDTIRISITHRDGVGDDERSLDFVAELPARRDASAASPPAIAECEPLAAGERFTKLDATGLCLPRTASGHHAVLDARTGLVWLTQTVGDRCDFDEAAKRVAALPPLDGKGWRLPTLDDLESIRDIARHAPAIDTAFFPDTKSDWYWTSSPAAWAPERDAWIVSFNYGGANAIGRGLRAFVRAVRSASAPGQ